MRALLLPGLDGTGQLFAPLLPALPRAWDVEVVAYPSDDPLGYDALERLVRQRFRGEDSVVIAESFSGPLGIRLAAAPPPGLRALVLVATFSRCPVPRLLARLAARLAGVLPTVPPAIGVRMLLTGRGHPELAEGVRAAMATLSPAVVRARLEAIAGVDVRSELSQAQVPVLALCATRDRLVPTRALAGLPHAAVARRIPGPHLLLQAAPKTCVEVMMKEAPARASLQHDDPLPSHIQPEHLVDPVPVDVPCGDIDDRLPSR
ncbi:alpha/beta hydrolase [Pseudenhygromyxa sp. WMMC2535]|uniref:alpha/beta fold hydrolase n=1 Tax=Pseudenhygromyxa sp. WMMC2535 TaxID=2712867 RepID=UPI001554B172|nr:alpha/beta hydrolase [Pseudenhygromyxa sp. WMMC2535]